MKGNEVKKKKSSRVTLGSMPSLGALDRSWRAPSRVAQPPQYLSGKVSSACSTGDHETQIRLLGWEDALEEEMATQSSILAWEIP